MSHKQAKQQRKLGLTVRPKYVSTPFTFDVNGEEVYYPRTIRRKLLRNFVKDVRRGKINLADVIAKKREHDRAQS